MVHRLGGINQPSPRPPFSDKIRKVKCFVSKFRLKTGIMLFCLLIYQQLISNRRREMPVFWFENVKQALARGETQCFASIWCLADVSLMSSGSLGSKSLVATCTQEHPGHRSTGRNKLWSQAPNVIWKCTNLWFVRQYWGRERG